MPRTLLFTFVLAVLVTASSLAFADEEGDDAPVAVLPGLVKPRFSAFGAPPLSSGDLIVYAGLGYPSISGGVGFGITDVVSVFARARSSYGQQEAFGGGIKVGLSIPKKYALSFQLDADFGLITGNPIGGFPQGTPNSVIVTPAFNIGIEDRRRDVLGFRLDVPIEAQIGGTVLFETRVGISAELPVDENLNFFLFVVAPMPFFTVSVPGFAFDFAVGITWRL